MNTKNKRVSHPKHLKNQIYLRFLKELKAQLDMDSTVSTSKIAEQFHVSHQIVSILRKSGGIRKIGIGKHEWKIGEPTMAMVDEINSQLNEYRMNLKEKVKLTFPNPFFTEQKMDPLKNIKNDCELMNGEIEFDFDAPDVGKRETLLERQMRKSTNVIELDENAMKEWEQKMKEQKAEKSDVPFVAPTDSSMVSEFIEHDKIDEQRPDQYIHLTKYEKLMALSLICLAVTMAFSVCYITYLFSKNF